MSNAAFETTELLEALEHVAATLADPKADVVSSSSTHAIFAITKLSRRSSYKPTGGTPSPVGGCLDDGGT